MAGDGKALAEAFKALNGFSVRKLDYPKHCKHRSGQVEGKDGWQLDDENPSRKFKVWDCAKHNRRVIWRDCRDNDKKHGCAEVDDGE